MSRLHEKGLITNPVSKAKSVGMTEEGFKKSESLFTNFLWEIKSPPANKSLNLTGKTMRLCVKSSAGSKGWRPTG